LGVLLEVFQETLGEGIPADEHGLPLPVLTGVQRGQAVQPGAAHDHQAQEHHRPEPGLEKVAAQDAQRVGGYGVDLIPFRDEPQQDDGDEGQHDVVGHDERRPAGRRNAPLRQGEQAFPVMFKASRRCRKSCR